MSPTAATFYFYRSFWRLLRNQALETLSWNFSGTFSGTLLNLTWLSTKASHLFRNLPRNPVELHLALHQIPHLLQNILRNPVEPDLPLHQSLPNLLQNLFRNPVDDLALHQSLPDLLRASSLDPCWTSPRSAPKPPGPEPSPQPCWIWPGCTKASHLQDLLRNPVEPGSAPKPPRTFFGTFLLWNPVELDLALHQKSPSGTFSGTLLNLTMALQQNLPDLDRNLLRNPVEPDLALHFSRTFSGTFCPEPRWT